MAQQQVKRPRLTIERLLDKADGYMTLQGLAAQAAVRKAMPEEILSIPMDDIRSMCESALVAKLAQKRSRERYRDTERRSEQVQRQVAQVMDKINAQVQKKAEVLARVTYVMHGTPVPLLTMSLEDHTTKRLEAQRTKKSADARRDFHDTAIKALKAGGKDRISELSTDEIVRLAEKAEAVWGGSE